VPVVAADRGGVRTAVADGRTGVLVRRLSTERLAAAVAPLIDDAGRRRALAARAIELARAQFDLRTTVTALLEPLQPSRVLAHERA
jgi:D-inositol-3-phosphate glycosyltransferase